MKNQQSVRRRKNWSCTTPVRSVFLISLWLPQSQGNKGKSGKLLCGQEKYVKFHFFSKNVRETSCFPFSHVLWSLKKLYNAKAKCVLIAKDRALRVWPFKYDHGRCLERVISASSMMVNPKCGKILLSLQAVSGKNIQQLDVQDSYRRIEISNQSRLNSLELTILDLY